MSQPLGDSLAQGPAVQRLAQGAAPAHRHQRSENGAAPEHGGHGAAAPPWADAKMRRIPCLVGN